MELPSEGGPSAVTIDCLVTWNDRRKVITVRGQDKSDVIGALSKTDFRSALEGGRIEVYNTRFNEYVEVHEDYTFSDGDKIKLVNDKEGADCTLLQLSPSPEATIRLTPGVTDSQPSSSAEKEYTLPAVPLDIQIEVINVKQGEVSSRLKSRIVTWIANNLRTISLYPRGLYEAAAKALVLKYPQLADTIGTGHDSWKVLFRYKLGNIRKSLEPIPAVQLARQKFGRRSGTSQSEDGQVKRACRMFPGDIAEAQDETAISGHIDFMSKEVKRRSPNMAQIADSMKKTRSSRRSWIMKELPSTKEIIERYPALHFPEMLHEEFLDITGISFEKKLLAFVNTYGERCFGLAKSHRLARQFASCVEEELLALTGDAKKYCFAVGVLEILPLLLKEKAFFFKKPNAYPSLDLKGKEPRNAVEIAAEFEEFSVEVVDAIAGVTALVQIYYAFNVQYAPHNKHTFAVLEHFCGLRCTSTSPLVKRIITAMEKGMANH
uniref:Sterile alpha motif domain-containing protein 3-like n=1 Tax=Rhipicephalus zambeziensis TaxID=60191 RepID=A0A224YZ42_9ACAR